MWQKIYSRVDYKNKNNPNIMAFMNFRLLIASLLLNLTLCAHAQLPDNAQPQLQMNGLALHEELGQALFIGAIYSSTAHANAEQLISYDGQRKMELRIITPRLSHRRLNKLWVEGAAVNSSRDALISQARHMARLTSLIKAPLRTGDQLSLISVNPYETAVTLNGTTLGSINSKGFFNLILKTWVGRVPLSSKFREDLLNNQTIDANLRGQYATTEPSQERRQLIASWVTPLPAAEPEIDIQTSEPVLEDIAATKTEAEATTPAIQGTEPQPESERPVKSKELQVKVASQSKKLAEQARRQQLAQQLAEEEKASKILLSRQLYQSELLRHTYKNIRYPSRAVERGQEGSIRVEITVTRDGQLAAMQELENSKFSLLNKAAKRSIERSSPYPPVPEDLEGEEFTFTLPIVFRLE